MSDDLSKRKPQDASKINMHENWELEYWSKELGVSKEKIREAVKVVVASAAAAAVKRYL
ncbi:DUF3606 domain-containing protein [uncultured Chryseobacterium sp.]|uniref:DUF3606 domain-containing protein n=1 Tax=uncultured Chryseobacterium sp. TaxID=259322 RepID=UPI0025E00AAF|nr:DUF3606 domain-containing protein [uncultured Chryseobacterium sp.]